MCRFLKGNRIGKQQSRHHDLVSKPYDTEPYLEGLRTWRGGSLNYGIVEPVPSSYVEVENFQMNRERRKQSQSVITQGTSPNHHLISWLPNNIHLYNNVLM